MSYIQHLLHHSQLPHTPNTRPEHFFLQTHHLLPGTFLPGRISRKALPVAT